MSNSNYVDSKEARVEAFSFVDSLGKFFSIKLTVCLFGKPIFNFEWPPKSV